MCSPFDGTLPEDTAQFLALTVEILQYAVQYDFNGAINIKDVCEIMKNEDLGTPLERLGELNE